MTNEQTPEELEPFLVRRALPPLDQKATETQIGDAELEWMRDAYAKSQTVTDGLVGDPTGPYAKDSGATAIRDVGRLLDELDRRKAWLHDELRELLRKHHAELAARDASIVALSARLAAKNAELDKVIREAAADKARLAAVEAPREYRCPWCTSTRWTSVTVEGRAMAQCALCEAIHTDLGLTSAPEMPRPPAEEAQERPETAGTGSGRGTGVAETSGVAQESEVES